MAGRFSIRRIAPPEPAPVGNAVVAEAVTPSVVPEAVPEVTNPLLSAKLLDAKVRLHHRLIEETNLAALEKLATGEIRNHVQQLVSQYVLAERLALNA